MFVVCVIVLGFFYGAKAEPIRIIKSVPEEAVIEYKVKGKVIQSMILLPGTYEITVRDLAADGVIHGRPRRNQAGK
jgi:hypothetical protein